MAGLTTTRIGSACKADWKAISALQQLYFPDDPTAVSKAEFVALVAGEGGQVIVVRAGMNLAGYLILRRKKFLPWDSIAFVAVNPDHQGFGVGKKLMTEAVEKSRRFFLRLHVRKSNGAALSLYRGLGFVVTGGRKNNYDDGETALAMMRWNGMVFWRITTAPQQLGRHTTITGAYD